MINIRRRDSFNFYESFSDLIFCTLVLFLVLVLFLSLNVNRRLEGIGAVEAGLASESTDVMTTVRQAEDKQTGVKILKEQLEDETGKIQKIENLEKHISNLKEELRIKGAQVANRREKLTGESDRSKGIDNQEIQLASLQKELENKQLLIAQFKEKHGAEVERIKELEKLKESAIFEDTSTGKTYNLSGSKGHGIMVPCYWEYNVMLVVDRASGKMTFEGEQTTWAKLPDLLSKVPYRHRTWLCCGLGEKMDFKTFYSFTKGVNPINERWHALCREFGFKGTVIKSTWRLGTKADEVRPPKLVPFKPYGNP